MNDMSTLQHHNYSDQTRIKLSAIGYPARYRRFIQLPDHLTQRNEVPIIKFPLRFRELHSLNIPAHKKWKVKFFNS